jgi:hypothetical protein
MRAIVFFARYYLEGAGCVLAEELIVYDADSTTWRVAKPLLNIAWQLEQGDDTYSWHSWRKSSIDAFLARLPQHCAVMVGVWRTEGSMTTDATPSVTDILVIGLVCEIVSAEIRSIRTFDSLTDPRLPSVESLEPGYQHALELMRVAREQVAPVAWALFTDEDTWNEWILTEDDSSHSDVDKGKLLTLLAQQGRCVLLGSQTIHHREKG